MLDRARCHGIIALCIHDCGDTARRVCSGVAPYTWASHPHVHSQRCHGQHCPHHHGIRVATKLRLRLVDGELHVRILGKRPRASEAAYAAADDRDRNRRTGGAPGGCRHDVGGRGGVNARGRERGVGSVVGWKGAKHQKTDVIAENHLSRPRGLPCSRVHPVYNYLNRTAHAVRWWATDRRPGPHRLICEEGGSPTTRIRV